MAMKIPASNPFAVTPTTPSVEGLVGYKHDNTAKLRNTEYAARVAKWENEQDEAVANDLINQIQHNDNTLRDDPENGYKAYKGKNAMQNEDGKGLHDIFMPKRKEFMDGLNLHRYSQGVRKRVMEFDKAQSRNFSNQLDAHIFRENEVWLQSLDEENMRIYSQKALSDDPAEARDGLIAAIGFTDKKAARAGVNPDYTKTVGPLVEMQARILADKKQYGDAMKLLDDNAKYIDPLALSRTKRSIRKSHEKALFDVAENGIASKMETDFSDMAIAKEVYRDMVGKDVDETQLKQALEDADGDVESALQSVVESSLKESMKNGDPKVIEERVASASKSLAARVEQARHMSVDDVALYVKQQHPDIPAENAVNAARKYVLNREMRYKQEQAGRDEQATMVFQSIRGGSRFSDIPETGTRLLKKSTKQALEKLSQRQLSGSLQDDTSLVYGLKTNPKRLASLSDEDFISLAYRMKPETFDFLSTVRDEIKAGKRPKDPKFHMAPMIRDAMTMQGIKTGSGTSEKQMAGMVFEVLEEMLDYEAYKAGRPLTQDEVNEKVGKVVATNFVFPDAWYAINDSATGKQLMTGKSVDMHDDVEALLNAGLVSQGIYEPTDVNRTRSIVSIALMPKRPIEGAEAMVEYLRTKKSRIYNQIVAEAKEKGITDIDPSRFVRAALKKMSAYKQQ